MKVEDSEAAVQSRGDSAPMLVALGIEKAFDRTRALSGAELDVYPGEVMGLLGANGAGKSTLSKVISGQVIRDAGSITLRGRPSEPANGARGYSTWDHDGHARDLAGPRSFGPRECLSGGTRPARIALLPPAEAPSGRNPRPAWSKRNVAVGSRGSPSLRGPTPAGRDCESAGTQFHVNHFRRTNRVFEST